MQLSILFPGKTNSIQSATVHGAALLEVSKSSPDRFRYIAFPPIKSEEDSIREFYGHMTCEHQSLNYSLYAAIN
jgi:hypothetical protein